MARPLAGVPRPGPAAKRIAARLSAVGLRSTILAPATGVYAALIHPWGSGALMEASYGLAILVKLAVVAAVATVGAINRWVVAPSLGRGSPARLGRLVRGTSDFAGVCAGGKFVVSRQ